MSELMKMATIYAGSLGQFQGLTSFVQRQPDAYTKEELIKELVKLSDEVNAKTKNP
jgi:hypothetical protein